MQKRTKLTLAGGAAALIGLGAIVGAAQADWGGQRDSHRGGMGFFFKQMAERYDANKDGKISQDEIDKNRADWLARFDADKDGSLSLKEFEALWLEARRQEMVREFQHFDKDGDAKVTLDEYKEPLAHIVANRDRNGDGFLSKDDRDQRRWRHRSGKDKTRSGDDDNTQDKQ